MRLFKDISVRLKIVLIITTISAISVLLSLMVNLTTKIVEAKNEYRSNAIKDARLLGDYCVMPIEFNYPDRAQDVLNTNITEGNIYCAAVYTSDGKLFSMACRESDKLPETIETDVSRISFTGDILVLSEPIIHNGNSYGTFHRL